MLNAKPLVWLHGEVKSPPFSHEARVEAGFLLRRLQNGNVDSDAIVVLEVFQKKTRTTPRSVVEVAKKRLRAYQRLTRED